MARAPKHHIQLTIKGPLKSAKRAAQRHGIHVSSCRVPVPGGDVQCYAPCTKATNHKVVEWFSERSQAKAGRGFPPGTLLHHGMFCANASTGVYDGTRRRQRSR